MLVPANRFEVLECRAAIDAVAENAQDTPPLRIGALDVLAQHVLGCACGEPFVADELYREVKTAAPYAGLTRADFDAVVDFVATGGYALKAYERFAKIRQTKDGRWRIANPMVAQRYRMNVGTIVEADMLKVRLVRSRAAATATPGRSRAAAACSARSRNISSRRWCRATPSCSPAKSCKYEALVEDEVYVSRSQRRRPEGAGLRGRQVSALDLSRRPRAPHAGRSDSTGAQLPDQVREWLRHPAMALAGAGRSATCWSRPFRAATSIYLVCYPFEGRLAHQTLGMLLTRRLERARLRPLGFVANEYALAVWGLGDVALRIERGELSLAALFDEDMLGDDLEAWLAESALMKRTFRNCAIIAGLIERRFPGQEKVAPPGHDLDRPRLRRAAQAPARPRAAARGARRRRDRPARHQAARRNALAHQGPNHP